VAPTRARSGVRRPVAERVSKHRKAPRAAGLRPIQIWVPDVRSKNLPHRPRDSPGPSHGARRSGTISPSSSPSWTGIRCEAGWDLERCRRSRLRRQAV